jgi:tellurite methyltransferase
MNNYNSFDDVYKTTDWYYGLKPFRELPETLEKLNFPTQPHALDLGCGEGRDSIYLATKGFNVTAIDISELGLLKLKDFSQKHNLTINCICIDALKYEYVPEQYELIVARTFLDHLTKDQITHVVEKIRATLRPSGVLFVSVFTTQDAGFLKTVEEGESECAAFIQHYFEENELKNYFVDWQILTYYERTKLDTSHGLPHQHGVAHLVAQKPA